MAVLSFLIAAGCGSGEAPDEKPDIVANISTHPGPAPEATPKPRPASPPPKPLQPRADPSTMPVALQGRWTGIEDKCSDASAALELTIMPDRLVFHESVGTLGSVVLKGDGSYAVTADFTGEGESWTRTLLLQPGKSAGTMVIDTEGTVVARRRC